MEHNDVFLINTSKFIPIYTLNRAGNLSDHTFNDKFGPLKIGEKGSLAFVIIGYTLGGILLIACVHFL